MSHLAMSLSAHPSSNLSDPTPAPASGRIRLGPSDQSASRVDLVWRDPRTGAALTLDLEACPALLASLRDAGFEVQAGASTGEKGTQAA